MASDPWGNVAKVVWIAFGGAAGTIARYTVSAWMSHALGLGIPYGTLAVNLLGSFLIGLLFAVWAGSDVLGPTATLALTTGFLGGFTTYSTFSLETFKFLQASAWSTAALYVGVTLAGCLAGTWLGWALGTWFLGTPAPAR